MYHFFIAWIVGIVGIGRVVFIKIRNASETKENEDWNRKTLGTKHSPNRKKRLCEKNISNLVSSKWFSEAFGAPASADPGPELFERRRRMTSSGRRGRSHKAAPHLPLLDDKFPQSSNRRPPSRWWTRARTFQWNSDRCGLWKSRGKSTIITWNVFWKKNFLKKFQKNFQKDFLENFKTFF